MKRTIGTIPVLALTLGACSGSSAPTVAEAEAFIAEVEAELVSFGEYQSRVDWVYNNFITFDTEWLSSRVSAEGTEMSVRFADQARRFDGLELPGELRRKLDKLKLAINIPAPQREGAAKELADVTTRLSSTYSTGTIDMDGRRVTLPELEERMGTERNPDRLLEMWTEWREVPVSMRDDYARMIEIGNEGALELGYPDIGAMWRSGYDLDPEAFIAETDRLWQQVKPLYDPLFCHVRAELNEFYGDDVVPKDGPIPAHVLGNMWAQDWSNIYQIVAPPSSDPGYDLTERLVANGYDARKMVETGEAFFSSLGFEPLPRTFWERSLIEQPPGREVVCHASAWDLDYGDDIRIKMCTRVNAVDFGTVHHELGHNYYQRAYNHLSPILQSGAHAGFHEAIGDMVALSITPEYLRQIGLISAVPDASADLGLLMDRALSGVAFLPFGLLMDRWRWQAFSGELTPEEYNDGWWALREQYQGVRPPVARRADHFDPGGKFHIPNNTEYTRYFLAGILQYQFHRAACEIAGWDGPLHRCSVYGNEEVGRRFNAMLEMGMSRPWPDALEAFTGSREMDASAVVEYYAPLVTWLEEQNQGRLCGW